MAIRTVEFGADGSAVLGVGGGITADSDPDLEWDECLHKAAPIVGAMRSAAALDEDLGQQSGSLTIMSWQVSIGDHGLHPTESPRCSCAATSPRARDHAA